jgi:hypothetical protein
LGFFAQTLGLFRKALVEGIDLLETEAFCHGAAPFRWRKAGAATGVLITDRYQEPCSDKRQLYRTAKVPDRPVDLTGQLCRRSHACPLEQWPDVGAASAADLAGKLGLKIRQAHVIAPASGIHDDRMRALVIGAIDEQPARAGLPHFPESDLLALRSVPAAGRWVIGQAFHSRPFLIQALLDKPTLKVRKIGLKQSSISDDVAIMRAQTGDLLVDHRRHLK